MFDRISPVYDVMNRVMTAGLDRRWRRLTVEAVVRPGDRVLDAVLRHRRSRARARSAAGGDVTGLDFSRRDARARAPQVERRSSGCEGDLTRAALRGRELRRRHGRVRDPQRRRPRGGPRRAPRVLRPRRAARLPRDHAAARHPAAVLPPLVRRVVPLLGQRPARRRGLHVPPRERAPLPGAGRARAPRWSVRASRTSPGGSWPAASSRSTSRGSRRERARDGPRRRRGSTRYLDVLELRLEQAVGSHPGLVVAGGDGDARRGRQAAPAGARLPGDAAGSP